MSKNISREKIKEENLGYRFSSDIEIKIAKQMKWKTYLIAQQ
jgi:hypothetical protein